MNDVRITRVMTNLKARGLMQIFICDPMSIKWLTGYYTLPFERFFGLLLAADKEPVMFCNRLFPDASGACTNVILFDDTDDPIPLLADQCLHDQALGIDKELAAKWLLPLMHSGAAQDYLLASDAVDGARSIKDTAEQQAMRAASATNDKAMAWLRSQVKAGVTEFSIAERLLAEYRRLGAQDHSFEPIVSFGANAADPHHEPDNTVLQDGQIVLFDVGCKQDDYCSDMTRTFWFAGEKNIEPDDLSYRVYETVRQANEAAEAIVRPGVSFAEIDKAARDVIAAQGWGEYFTHRLGHQIGLVDHEPGDVSSTHDEPVQVGQVFSIEPGVYIPGKVGVRIEDLLIVTEDGCEILNSYPKELIQVH